MKDQYVGDISDFEKYVILRALAFGADLPLVICWMLTPPDETGEGARIDYLKRPDRYRHLDAHVFDRLAAIIARGERSVSAIEQSGILDRAQFFTRSIEDHVGSRSVYFREVWSGLQERSLVFFDPDIGLASTRMQKRLTRGFRLWALEDLNLRPLPRQGQSGMRADQREQTKSLVRQKHRCDASLLLPAFPDHSATVLLPNMEHGLLSPPLPPDRSSRPSRIRASITWLSPGPGKLPDPNP
jgi:hypothetical protein